MQFLCEEPTHAHPKDSPDFLPGVGLLLFDLILGEGGGASSSLAEEASGFFFGLEVFFAGGGASSSQPESSGSSTMPSFEVFFGFDRFAGGGASSSGPESSTGITFEVFLTDVFDRLAGGGASSSEPESSPEITFEVILTDDLGDDFAARSFAMISCCVSVFLRFGAELFVFFFFDFFFCFLNQQKGLVFVVKEKQREKKQTE